MGNIGIQFWTAPGDPVSWPIFSPVEKLEMGSLFLGAWIFNKPDDTSGKVKICEPYLGHI